MLIREISLEYGIFFKFKWHDVNDRIQVFLWIIYTKLIIIKLDLFWKLKSVNQYGHITQMCFYKTVKTRKLWNKCRLCFLFKRRKFSEGFWVYLVLKNSFSIFFLHFPVYSFRNNESITICLINIELRMTELIPIQIQGNS